MKRLDLAAFALLVLSMVRIATTWTIYSATVDEPMHITAGLQLYTQHAYTYQPENPPLPRLVLAFIPWIGGMEFVPSLDVSSQLFHVFHSKGRYMRNLVLARSGNLFFFAIASLAVWWWARREFGPAGGCIAMFLFTFQPLIVGHAGLATHDLAATGTTTLALMAYIRWLDSPTIRRAAIFGVAYGAAILCKFSCIGYIPAACLLMYRVRVMSDKDQRAPWKAIGPAILATAATIAIGYLFHIERFITGVKGLADINRNGMYSYFFGQVSARGFWLYFPVGLALKSTIASLILAIAGLFTRRRAVIEAFAAAIGILLVAMPSTLDLGVRYVIPMYAPLTISATAAVLHFRRRWIPIALLGWHLIASVVAYPDAFPYFNELAQPRPWEYLIDSNIDWGQDVLRLREVCREKKIDRIGHAVLGWHDWDALGFPPNYRVQRDVPTQGWIAVSEHIYGLAHGTPWLEGRRYQRVGKSIRLYYVP